MSGGDAEREGDGGVVGGVGVWDGGRGFPQSRPERREGRRGGGRIIEPIAEGATTHKLKVQDWLIIDQDKLWVNIVLRVATANTR